MIPLDWSFQLVGTPRGDVAMITAPAPRRAGGFPGHLVARVPERTEGFEPLTPEQVEAIGRLVAAAPRLRRAALRLRDLLLLDDGEDGLLAIPDGVDASAFAAAFADLRVALDAAKWEPRHG